MNRKIVTVVVLCAVVIGAAAGWYLYHKQEEGPAGMKAGFTSTVDSLFDEFRQDETAAGMKYNDRYILVTGRVKETPDTAGGKCHVLLIGTGKDVVACEMHPDFSGEALSLRPGDEANIQGKCTGIKSVAKDLGDDFSEMLGDAGIPDEISFRNCMVVK